MPIRQKEPTAPRAENQTQQRKRVRPRVGDCAATRGMITDGTTIGAADTPGGELELDEELVEAADTPGGELELDEALLEDSLAINAESVQQTRLGKNKRIVSVPTPTRSQVKA
jgi:hypothetical protein